MFRGVVAKGELRQGVEPHAGGVFKHVLVEGTLEELDHLFRQAIAGRVVWPCDSMVDAKSCAQCIHMFCEFLSAVTLEDFWRRLVEPQELEGLGDLGRSWSAFPFDGDGPCKLGKGVDDNDDGLDSTIARDHVEGVYRMVPKAGGSKWMSDASRPMQRDLIHLLAFEKLCDVDFGDAGVRLLDKGVEGIAATKASQVRRLEEGREDGISCFRIVRRNDGEVAFRGEA